MNRWKRETWPLPKWFVPKYNEHGTRVFRYDHEVQTLPLDRLRENPNTLSTSYRVECCECGYTHTFLFNVWQSKKPGMALAIQAISHETTRLGRRGLKITKIAPKRRPATKKRRRK